ncbi:MAG: hypothetical protein HY676_04955 [Chloroflexi bacterium]|nr:hypothetical protein [Chloroflexota bacterium]
MKKRFVLSALASAVTVLILNGVIYALFYGDFLKNNSGLSVELFEKVQRPVDQTNIPATILSMLVIGCLITTVVHWVKAKTFINGLKFGFIFAVLMVGSVNLGLLATTYYYSTKSGIIDIFVGAATIAIGGGVAALIMGGGTKPAKA